MTKADVEKVIVDVLSHIQQLSGRGVAKITASTCPIGDLEQFDSLSGVEATVELSSRLGFELPGVNAFVNQQGTRALNVGEVADGICNSAGEV
jgi:acyl carrier protein